MENPSILFINNKSLIIIFYTNKIACRVAWGTISLSFKVN